MKKLVFLAAFALISANTMAQESEPVQEQNRNRVENRTQNQEALQAGEADGSETASQARQRLQQQEKAGQAEGTQTAEQARERKMDGELPLRPEMRHADKTKACGRAFGNLPAPTTHCRKNKAP